MRHGISPVRFRPLLTAATIDSALRRRRIQHRGNFDQQVLSAQPTTARAPVLQGETSGPNYGAADVRHLKVRSGALRQRIQDKWMAISFCPGVDQLADGLTKVLASKRMDMLMKAWGMTVSELRKGVEPPGQVRRLHASAEPQQQQDITTTAHQPPTGNLSCCLGLLVLLQGLTSVRADENPEAPTPLAMDSSLELYGLMLMLVICIIALWEAGRVCVRTQGTAARLRSCMIVSS